MFPKWLASHRTMQHAICINSVTRCRRWNTPTDAWPTRVPQIFWKDLSDPGPAVRPYIECAIIHLEPSYDPHHYGL
jgi:hypothetical protein